jgi:hypothetical protein
MLGFLTGIFFFSVMNKNRERRVNKFNKIKEDLNRGFAIDKENLNHDWQNIYFDIDKSFQKMKRDSHYEAI